MALYKRGQVWWMCFTYKGQQVRRSTETSDKRLAEKICRKVMTQIDEGKWFERPPDDDRSFQQMMDKYMTEYSISKTRSSQVREKVIAANLKSFFGDRLLKEITPSMIVDYKSARRKDGILPATIERELDLLRRAFNLAVREWEWCSTNPVSRISRERFNNQIDRWLSPEEEKRLHASCQEWLREIVIFALNTGMRQGEILDLKWPCVDLFRKTVTIMRSKNGERRTIPLNQAALEVLKSKARIRHIKSDYVFSSGNGTMIIGRNLQRAFCKALEKAKIKEFRFHDLRHTFATRLVQSGIDLYTVAKLLGHKDIRMTQRYAHHCPESLRSGVEVLQKFITILSQSEVLQEGRAT